MLYKIIYILIKNTIEVIEDSIDMAFNDNIYYTNKEVNDIIAKYRSDKYH